VLENGLVGPMDEGTPQGGPLRLYYRILFSINLTVSWSKEGIGSLGIRTIVRYERKGSKD
jgi:hypothetical protein